MVIDEDAKNVLFDAEIVCDYFEFMAVGRLAGFAHLLRPRGSGELDGTLLPVVRFAATDAAGKFLPSHQRKLLGFEDQLVRGGAVGGDDAAERAEFSDMKDQRTSIDVPDDGDFVAIQIELGALRGAPVGRYLRELSNDERFDVRTRGFFIIEICPHVADVGIGEANDLPCITGIGENFLITGEAGVENDFAAAACNGASGTAVKYAPVLERENGGSVQNFRQCVLRPASFVVGLGGRQGTEMVHRPVSEHRAAVDKAARDRAKDA